MTDIQSTVGLKRKLSMVFFFNTSEWKRQVSCIWLKEEVGLLYTAEKGKFS